MLPPFPAAAIDALGPTPEPLLLRGLAAAWNTTAVRLRQRCDTLRALLAAGDHAAALLALDDPEPLETLAESLRLRDAARWTRLAPTPPSAPPLDEAAALITHLTSAPQPEDAVLPALTRRALRNRDHATARACLRAWLRCEPADADLRLQLASTEEALAAEGFLAWERSSDTAARRARALELVGLPGALVDAHPSGPAVRADARAAERERQDALLARGDADALAELRALAAGQRLLADHAAAAEAFARADAAVRAEAAAAAFARQLARWNAEFDPEAAPPPAEAYSDAELDAILRDLASGGDAAATTARLVRRERARRAARRRTRVLVRTAAVAAVAAACVLGWMVVDAERTRADQERARREAALAEERRLEQLARLPQPDPAVVVDFTQRARALEQDLAGPPNPEVLERAATGLAALIGLAGGLPADRAREADARLASLRASVADWRARLTEEAGRAIEAAHAAVATLGDTSGPEEVRRVLQRVAPDLAASLVLVRSVAIGVPVAQRGRAEALAAEVELWTAKLGRHDEAAAALARTATLEEHLAAVGAMAGSPFASDPRVAAATRLRAALADLRGDLAQLAFAPAEPQLWDFVRANPAPSFIPPAAGAAPSAALQQLLTDETLRDVHQYLLLRVGPQGRSVPELVHTAGPAVAEEFTVGPEVRTRVAARLLLPQGIVLREFLSGTGPDGIRSGEVLDMGFRSPEALLVERIAEAVDAEAGVVVQPLLGHLESLVRETAASPVLRAHLFVRLAGVLEENPVAWGLRFSPSANEDLQLIRQVAAGALGSTSWVDPAHRVLNAQLGAFFREAAGVSYLREARFRAGLLARLQAGRMTFVGRVSEAGVPAAPGLREGATLWAFTGERARFERIDGQGRPAPLALSPLFTYDGDIAAAVTGAAEAAGLNATERERLAPVVAPLGVRL